MTTEHNWAGNVTYAAKRIHYPRSEDELCHLVASRPKLRALGSRHSFNRIADTEGELVSLAHLPRVIEIDRDRMTATVDGGARYGDICGELWKQGFALQNLASLPHISVAGACATATHGSGDRNQCLAAAVASLEIIQADGKRVTLSRGYEWFDGAVVVLGGLGIVIRVTLDLVPAFEVRQDVFEDLPVSAFETHFDEITASAYSVSLFTTWQADQFEQVWRKYVGPKSSAVLPFFGATPAAGPLHPISALSADCCTEQQGVCGPWHERLPHFRMEFTPSAGDELQSEYFVERRHAIPAIRAMFAMKEALGQVLQISEVRTIAADNLWMSPFYQRESVSLHFTWTRDTHGVETLLPRLEEALSPFDARPHWGKVFMMSSERFQTLYPRIRDFRELLKKYDPAGKFRNGFLHRHVFGEDA